MISASQWDTKSYDIECLALLCRCGSLSSRDQHPPYKLYGNELARD
jgi:hypothetical protein